MLVVSMETCPSHARMVLISTPARRRWLAVVCRIVCGLTRLRSREGHESLALFRIATQQPVNAVASESLPEPIHKHRLVRRS